MESEVGEIFGVQLKHIVDPEYRWVLRAMPSQYALIDVSHDTLNCIFRFKALTAGNGELVFQHVRPYELKANDPVQKIIIKVN